MRNLAEMGINHDFNLGGAPMRFWFDPHVASKCLFLHAPMNARFLKCLERSGLCMSEARFHAAFRKCPAPATGAHQEKFETAFADPIANRRNLFRSAHSAQLLQGNKIRRRLSLSDRRDTKT